MPNYEVSRTLVKSPPELWEELKGERLTSAVGPASVEVAQDGQALVWKGRGSRGTALLEPAGWGTKVTLSATVEEQVAEHGWWSRLRGGAAAPARADDLEQRLEALLDDLGAAHRKPFQAG